MEDHTPDRLGQFRWDMFCPIINCRDSLRRAVDEWLTQDVVWFVDSARPKETCVKCRLGYLREKEHFFRGGGVVSPTELHYTIYAVNFFAAKNQNICGPIAEKKCQIRGQFAVVIIAIPQTFAEPSRHGKPQHRLNMELCLAT